MIDHMHTPLRNRHGAMIAVEVGPGAFLYICENCGVTYMPPFLRRSLRLDAVSRVTLNGNEVVE